MALALADDDDTVLHLVSVRARARRACWRLAGSECGCCRHAWILSRRGALSALRFRTARLVPKGLAEFAQGADLDGVHRLAADTQKGGRLGLGERDIRAEQALGRAAGVFARVTVVV